MTQPGCINELDVIITLTMIALLVLIAMMCTKQLFEIAETVKRVADQHDHINELEDYQLGRFAETTFVIDPPPPVDPTCSNLGGSCNCTGYEWCGRSGRVGNS